MASGLVLCFCGCGREAENPSYFCNGHWSKRIEDRKKISLGLQKYNKIDLDLIRKCEDCGVEKSILEFYGKVKGIYCKECRKNRSKNLNRQEYLDRIKNSVIKATYGITLDEYKIIWDQQKGVCAICKNPETRKSRYGGICLLHIDHNHTTNKVRGLLCNLCNQALGRFRDNQNILKSAIEYLNKFNQNKQGDL